MGAKPTLSTAIESPRSNLRIWAERLRTSRNFSWFPAGVLLTVFLLQSFCASRTKSPTYDEPAHIASGLSYVETGEIRLNPQHPPLLKELAGLSLLLGGVRWPRTPQSRQAMEQGGPLEWTVGNSIISENGPDRVLFWARLPMILVGTMLGFVIYLWGRQIVGEAAALGALFLYSLDPIFLAHSALVTTDVGLAAFACVFLWALWNYLSQPDGRRLLLCGIAMGAMLAAKFSAVFFLPVAAVLLLAALRWPPQATPREVPKEQQPVGRNDLCPCGSGRKFKNCCGDSSRPAKIAPNPQFQRILASLGAFLAMCAVAAIVILVCYLSPGGLRMYLDGVQKVNADHDPGHLAYLAGEMAHRFTGYFAAAYLLKEPLASMILAGIGLFTLARNRAMGVLQKLFLILPPVVFFTACTLWADDFGVRYIIPALPFAFLLGGLGLMTLIRRHAIWSRMLAAVLGIWMTAAAIGIYPDHLSYFNEMAALLREPGRIGMDGGSKCGPLWLDDSNVDWGQGFKQLKVWADQHAPGQKIRLRYFGSFPPAGYGINYAGIGLPELFNPTPGMYVLSAHTVARLPGMAESSRPGAADWVRQLTPTAIIGHAFYVYTIRQKP
jgi:hypothetical protein